jgi:hypothetical protein
MELVEVFTSLFSNDDHVFNSHTSMASAVQAGFNGDDITGNEFRPADCEEWWLVNFESKPVTCTMSHAREAIWCICCG